MRFLINAQLPPELALFLKSRDHEASPVRELNLRDASDSAIWNFAQEGGWIIVTKDEDSLGALCATPAGRR